MVNVLVRYIDLHKFPDSDFAQWLKSFQIRSRPKSSIFGAGDSALDLDDVKTPFVTRENAE